eukprot:482790-Pyramimonas_sp.AAC.1
MGLPGWQDCLRPPSEQDSAGAEFARSQRVRDVARRLAMETTARDKIHKASKAKGPSQTTFSPGQWVFVWHRLTRAGSRADTLGRRRDAWTGPGVV